MGSCPVQVSFSKKTVARDIGSDFINTKQNWDGLGAHPTVGKAPSHEKQRSPENDFGHTFESYDFKPVAHARHFFHTARLDGTLG